MLTTAFLQPVALLRAETADGDLILCARLSAHTPVTLVFTHSMYGGFVAETYRLDASGRLERQRIVAERAAAAEYYATQGQVRRVEDGFEVLAGPFVADQLVVHVDQRGEYRLILGESTWKLFEMTGESTPLRFVGEYPARSRVPATCTTSIERSV
jgi:hypothetical protein